MVSSIGSIGTTTSLLSARPKPPDPTELFKKADADGDGKITKEELANAIAQAPNQGEGAPSADEIFEQMDADGDGYVTEDEHNSFLEQMQAKNEADQAITDVRLAQAGTPPPPPDPAELFAKTDADGDGKITKDELTEALSQMPQPPDGSIDIDKMFAEMDSDGDGYVTEDEHNAFLEKLNEQMRANKSETTLTLAPADDSGSTTDTSNKVAQYSQNLSLTVASALLNLEI